MCCKVFGTLVFGVCGGLVATNTVISKIYWFCLGLGFLILLAAVSYPASSESVMEMTGEEHHEHHEHHLPLSQKWALIKKILSIDRMSKNVKFIIIVSLTMINWEVFISYSNEEQYEITPLFEGGMLTITIFIATAWLMAYNSVFAHKKARYFVIFGLLCRFVSIYVSSQIVRTDISARTAKEWFSYNALLVLPVAQAYVYVPALIVFAKCVPESCSELMVGML